jgi:hypothetical protein
LIKNTLNFLTESGFQHDEANAICGQWNERQVKLDEENQKNGDENVSSKNDSLKISSVIGSGDLVQATKNIAIFDDHVLALRDAVNFFIDIIIIISYYTNHYMKLKRIK